MRGVSCAEPRGDCRGERNGPPSGFGGVRGGVMRAVEACGALDSDRERERELSEAGPKHEASSSCMLSLLPLSELSISAAARRNGHHRASLVVGAAAGAGRRRRSRRSGLRGTARDMSGPSDGGSGNSIEAGGSSSRARFSSARTAGLELST